MMAAYSNTVNNFFAFNYKNAHMRAYMSDWDRHRNKCKLYIHCKHWNDFVFPKVNLDKGNQELSAHLFFIFFICQIKDSIHTGMQSIKKTTQQLYFLKYSHSKLFFSL